MADNYFNLLAAAIDPFEVPMRPARRCVGPGCNTWLRATNPETICASCARKRSDLKIRAAEMAARLAEGVPLCVHKCGLPKHRGMCPGMNGKGMNGKGLEEQVSGQRRGSMVDSEMDRRLEEAAKPQRVMEPAAVEPVVCYAYGPKGMRCELEPDHAGPHGAAGRAREREKPLPVPAEAFALVAADAELSGIAHGLAYDFAVSVIDSSSCVARDGQGQEWLDVTPGIASMDMDGACDEVADYLERRGLLERSAENRHWVLILDESEATA